MGMRFNAAIVEYNDESKLRFIANICRNTLPFKHEPKNINLISLESANSQIKQKWLQLISSVRRSWKLNTDHQLLESVFLPQTEENVLFEEFKLEASQYENFFLAKCASEVCQKSSFIIYSDILSCSGLLEFESGKLMTGQICGLKNENQLIVFDKGIFESKQISFKDDKELNYAECLEKELARRVGKYFPVEIINDSYYEKGSKVLEIPLISNQ